MRVSYEGEGLDLRVAAFFDYEELLERRRMELGELGSNEARECFKVDLDAAQVVLLHEINKNIGPEALSNKFVPKRIISGAELGWQ